MNDEKPAYPSRTADQFVVRFPDGMRDRLKEAAHAAGRSMNAEIIARLQESFARPDLSAVKLIGKIGDTPTIYDEIAARLASLPPEELDRPLRGILSEMQPSRLFPRLYLLIDSYGYPQSWPEIQELISAVARAGKLNAVEIEAQIITPDMESGSRRKKEVAELARRLRAAGASGSVAQLSASLHDLGKESSAFQEQLAKDDAQAKPPKP